MNGINDKKTTPLLVFAQSSRFIAGSAARAGYSVRVADCHADSDTLDVADESIQLPPFSELSETQLLQTLISLSHEKPCFLICGTGIERFYPVLSQLPHFIQVIGNSLQTLALMRKPENFFAMLDQLKLPYPLTCLSEPAPKNALRKRLDSTGGTAVFADGSPLENSEFYQQEIKGETRSVCFIADGENTAILGWNRQINQPGQFLLEQIWQTNKPPEEHAPQLRLMLQKLVKAAGLKGFNSLDYMLSANKEIFILELNPRISASVELLHQNDWLKWHIDSCRGQTLTKMVMYFQQAPVIRLLYYFYADKDLKIADQDFWPNQAHDRPAVGTRFKKGEVVCTFILAAESEQGCYEQLRVALQDLKKNCLDYA